jgi:4-amino-4-deoxy-L-arabinose transferase-like glycosyltransferase
VVPPPALGALMAVSLLLAVTWAAVLPAFQAPDEQSHFSYVQTLGAQKKRPGQEGRPFFSTQLSQGIRAVNSDQVAAQKAVKPEWDPVIADQWAATETKAPDDDGGGPGPATAYPPTAYAWQALGYAAASGSLFDELLGARLMTALWVPVTVLFTWLLAGEVFGRRRLLQTAAAAVPALAPMFAFVSASVSPDGMLCAVWTIALWLGVRCVKRALPLRDTIALLLVVAIACTVKPTSYALIPAALLVIALGVFTRHRDQPRRMAVILGGAAVALVVAVGAWLALGKPGDTLISDSVSTSGTNWRELASYLWQYYLPRTPVQSSFHGVSGYPLLQVWITQGWATFGWLEVKFDPWVYRILALITVAIAAAALVALWRARARVDRRVLAFLGVTFVILLLGLHWTDYHQLKQQGQPFMQGRYLFPVISVFGLTLAAALSIIPLRLRPAAAGVALGGLLVFHLFALGLVVVRFYA